MRPKRSLFKLHILWLIIASAPTECFFRADEREVSLPSAACAQWRKASTTCAQWRKASTTCTQWRKASTACTQWRKASTAVVRQFASAKISLAPKVVTEKSASLDLSTRGQNALKQ